MRTVMRSLEAAAPEPAAEEAVVEEELPQPSRTPNAREATIALHTARLLIFLSLNLFLLDLWNGTGKIPVLP